MESRIRAIGHDTRAFIVDRLLDDVCDGDEDLSCACAVASYINDRVLTIAGFNSRLMLGDLHTCAHCWTEIDVKNEILCLDVTATQFGQYDRIVLLPKSAYLTLGFMHDLKLAQRARPTTSFADWREQSPLQHMSVIESHINDRRKKLNETAHSRDQLRTTSRWKTRGLPRDP